MPHSRFWSSVVFPFCIVLMFSHSPFAIQNALIGIRYTSFSNPNGTLASGQCCDDPTNTSGNCPPDLCDTTFIPCGTRDTKCDVYPDQHTPVTYNNNSFTIDKYIGNGNTSIRNLVVINYEYSPKPLFFTMRADESSSSHNNTFLRVIGNYSFTVDWVVPMYISKPNFTTFTLQDRNTELVVEIVSQCRRGYYTHDCSVYCRSDKIHYYCLDNGTKACYDGWEGPNCLTMIDFCPGNQCQHGSTCVPIFLNYTCTCPPGYTGYFCETILPTSTASTRAPSISPPSTTAVTTKTSGPIKPSSSTTTTTATTKNPVVTVPGATTAATTNKPVVTVPVTQSNQTTNLQQSTSTFVAPFPKSTISSTTKNPVVTVPGATTAATTNKPVVTVPGATTTKNPIVTVPGATTAATTKNPVVTVPGATTAATTKNPVVILPGATTAATTKNPVVTVPGATTAATTKNPVVIVPGATTAATTKNPVVTVPGATTAATTKNPVVIVPGATTAATTKNPVVTVPVTQSKPTTNLQQSTSTVAAPYPKSNISSTARSQTSGQSSTNTAIGKKPINSSSTSDGVDWLPIVLGIMGCLLFILLTFVIIRIFYRKNTHEMKTAPEDKTSVNSLDEKTQPTANYPRQNGEYVFWPNDILGTPKDFFYQNPPVATIYGPKDVW